MTPSGRQMRQPMSAGGPGFASARSGVLGTERPPAGAGRRATPGSDGRQRTSVAQLVPGAQPVLCMLFLIAGRASEAAAPHAALALYAASYLAGGTGSALAAWRALRERRIDVNALMLLAAIGAAYLGSWTEGAVLLVLFSTSNALEFYVIGRTRRAIRALMALRPAEALVRHGGRARDRRYRHRTARGAAGGGRHGDPGYLERGSIHDHGRGHSCGRRARFQGVRR